MQNVPQVWKNSKSNKKHLSSPNVFTVYHYEWCRLIPPSLTFISEITGGLCCTGRQFLALRIRGSASPTKVNKSPKTPFAIWLPHSWLLCICVFVTAVDTLKAFCNYNCFSPHSFLWLHAYVTLYKRRMWAFGIPLCMCRNRSLAYRNLRDDRIEQFVSAARRSNTSGYKTKGFPDEWSENYRPQANSLSAAHADITPRPKEQFQLIGTSSDSQYRHTCFRSGSCHTFLEKHSSFSLVFEWGIQKIASNYCRQHADICLQTQGFPNGPSPPHPLVSAGFQTNFVLVNRNFKSSAGQGDIRNSQERTYRALYKSKHEINVGIVVRIPAGARGFSPLQSVRTCFLADSTS
jgi:hypothetical protein